MNVNDVVWYSLDQMLWLWLIPILNVSVIQAKETLVIEKDPVFVPVESWLNAAQVREHSSQNKDDKDGGWAS